MERDVKFAIGAALFVVLLAVAASFYTSKLQAAHRQRCEVVNALPLVIDGQERCLAKEVLR